MSKTPLLATDVQSQVAVAWSYLERGQIAEASAVFDALAIYTADPEVQLLACEINFAAGDMPKALQAIRSAVHVRTGACAYLLKLADVLTHMRQRTEARQIAVEAEAACAGDARALWAIGRIHARCGDPQMAADLYRRASLSLSDPALLYDLGTASFFSSDPDTAEFAFDRVLTTAPQVGHAAYMRSTVRRQTLERNHVKQLEETIERHALPPRGAAGYRYALAKEFEDLGRHEEAFETLTAGAALMRQSLTYDAASEREAIDSIGRTFTAETLATIAPGWLESGAIFIVGMPRTGTTLLEHLMARHGGVASAGELADFGDILQDAAKRRVASSGDESLVEAARHLDFNEIGRNYMGTARQAASGAAVFVDKMPINFMYCGLINKALPRARILHLVRDPVDTCYAVYKTLFANAYPFSYGLTELADYYLTYHRLMQRWSNALPGVVMEVRYEDLVSAPEETVRRALDWCGVPWQEDNGEVERLSRPSMTASAAQVREPVHTRSVGASKRHAEGLAPLIERLRAGGVEI